MADRLVITESRSLNVKYGDRKPGEAVQFVHMLNGTLCATERALCCVIENYQTPDVSLMSPSLLPESALMCRCRRVCVYPRF